MRKWMFFGVLILGIGFAYRDIEQAREVRRLEQAIHFGQQFPQQQGWKIEAAERVRDASYAYVEGVTNQEQFLSLLKQAFRGDKNALLQVAITRLEDNEVTNNPFFYGEGFRSRVSQFIKKHRQRLISEDGTPLNEPELMTRNPWAMIKIMADAGHPASSHYYLFEKILNAGYVKPLTDEERTLGLRYLDHLMGEPRMYGFASYYSGNLLLFKDGRGTHEEMAENMHMLKSLTDARSGLTVKDKTLAIKRYQACAVEGNVECATHLVEAYTLGFGVQQSWVLAYAWAHIVNMAYLSGCKGEDKSSRRKLYSMHVQVLTILREGSKKTVSRRRIDQKICESES